MTQEKTFNYVQGKKNIFVGEKIENIQALKDCINELNVRNIYSIIKI